MLDTLQSRRVNNLDLTALNETVAAIANDPAQARLAFQVRTDWRGQTRSETTVESYRIAGERIERSFTVAADEPLELLGTNTAPNPQELLMAGVNACMMVGYIAQASVRGIDVKSCSIETEGELDLRGFLGLDLDVPAGYRRIDYRVRLEADAPRESLEEIHAAVQATSPNFFNMARPIQMVGVLV
jgi:uncharacterized OsmC-like protein